MNNSKFIFLMMVFLLFMRKYHHFYFNSYSLNYLLWGMLAQKMKTKSAFSVEYRNYWGKLAIIIAISG